MHLIVESGQPGASPAMDVAIAHAILGRASRGEVGATIRVSRPVDRTVAFGRTDLRRPRFGFTVEICRALGYAPIVRSTGGRVAAYTEEAVVIDHVSPDPAPGDQLRRRFADYGHLLAGILSNLGVDARVGEVAGEYCPGEFSVNARGRVKLVGTSQRVVRGAWLFSSVIVVGGGPELRALLRPVHDSLDLPFAPATVGSVAEEAPNVGVDEVEDAVVEALGESVHVEPGPMDAGLVDEAASLLPGHVIE